MLTDRRAKLYKNFISGETGSIHSGLSILAKNAILIVEFAVQRRRNGKPLVASALEAAKSRLRPIIMTSLTFIVGLIPMMRATGPSARGNHSISIGAAGGMLSGVILGLLIIPVLFVIFQSIQEKISKKSIEVVHHYHEEPVNNTVYETV